MLLTSSCAPQGLTLDPSTQTTNLQMMVASLGIPAAPVLKPPSERFTLVSLQSGGVGGLKRRFWRVLEVLGVSEEGHMS